MAQTLTLEEAIHRVRLGVLGRDRAMLRRMVQAYHDAWLRLQPEWDTLAEAMAAGRDKAWLLARLAAYQKQIEEELRKYAAWAAVENRQDILREIEASQKDLRRIIDSTLVALPPGTVASMWHQVPHDAILTAVGMTGPESPLMIALQEKMPPEVAARIGTQLRNGIALGWHPSVLQRELVKEFGSALQWSMAASRTSMMHAYFRTHQVNYMNNWHLIKGWLWYASLDDRTCLACTLMSGTFHPVTEALIDHWAGRCTPVPVTKSYRELGIPVDGPPLPPVRNGIKWFRGLDAAAQKKMMGPGWFEKWQSGQAKLSDIVTFRKDRIYGNMIARQALSRAGTGAVPPSLVMQEMEERLVALPVEHGYTIGLDGRIIDAIETNEVMHVPVSREQGKRAWGNIFIHNHPTGVHPNLMAPLSKQDVGFAAGYNVEQLWAVSSRGWSGIIRPTAGWRDWRHVVDEFDAAYKAQIDRWAATSVWSEVPWDSVLNAALKDLAQRIGAIYIWLPREVL